MKTLEAIQVITKAGMSITFNPDALQNKLRLTIQDRNSTKQFQAILEPDMLIHGLVLMMNLHISSMA